MARSADPSETARREVDDELARWITGVARTLVRRARVPGWLRDEAGAEIALAMVAAWVTGGVESRAGLWQVGWRAARASALSGQSLLSIRDARDLRGGAAVASVALVDLASGSATWPLHERPSPSPQSEAGAQVGALLHRLIAELAAAGLPAAQAAASVDALVDLCGATGGGARSVYETASDALGARLGLDPLAARALVVLVIGDPKRPGREGIVARHHAGEDVWSDPRVWTLIEEVVRPRRARLRNAWAPREPAAR